MNTFEAKNEEKSCCTCLHNIRKKDKKMVGIYCECEIDGHYIDYVACFERTCRRWKNENEQH